MYHVCTIVQRAVLSKPYDTKEEGGNINLTKRYNPVDFPIITDYSENLKSLIEKMLHRDWRERPSAKDILETTSDWPCQVNDVEKSKEIFAKLDSFKDVNIASSTFEFNCTQ